MSSNLLNKTLPLYVMPDDNKGRQNCSGLHPVCPTVEYIRLQPWQTSVNNFGHGIHISKRQTLRQVVNATPNAQFLGSNSYTCRDGTAVFS